MKEKDNEFEYSLIRFSWEASTQYVAERIFKATKEFIEDVGTNIYFKEVMSNDEEYIVVLTDKEVHDVDVQVLLITL